MSVMKKICILVIAAFVIFAYIPAADQVYAAAKKPGKVKSITVKKTKQNQITVKWKKAKRAKKYQVYVKVDNGKFKKVKTLKKRTYKMTGKAGKKYTFKVRAINKKKKGKFSKVKSVRIQNNVIITKKGVKSISKKDAGTYSAVKTGNSVKIQAKWDMSGVKRGNVIIMPVSQEYPTGYAVKVSSVTRGKAGTTVNGVQPDYSEVFDTINMSGEQQVDAIQNVIPAKNATVTMRHGSSKRSLKRGADISVSTGDSLGVSVTTEDGISIGVDMSNMRLMHDIDARFFPPKLNYIDVGLNMDTSISLGTETSGEAEFDVKESRMKLAQMDFIIYGAVVAPATLYLTVDVSGAVTLEAKFSEGVKYDRSKLKPYSTFTPTGIKAEGSFGAGVAAGVGISIAALPEFVDVELGLSFPIDLSVEAHFDDLNRTCMDLEPSIELTGSFGECFCKEHFSVFKNASLTFSKTLAQLHFEAVGTGVLKKVKICSYQEEYLKLYAPVIDEYNRLLKQIKTDKNFDVYDLERYGYSYVYDQIAEYAAGEGLNGSGKVLRPEYTFKDINQDGVKEMLIGDYYYSDYSIGSILTLNKSNKPVKLIDCNSYIYRGNLLVKSNGLIYSLSDHWANSYRSTYYSINSSSNGLDVVDDFVYDEGKYTYNGKTVSESYYQSIIDSKYKDLKDMKFIWIKF